ncbi:MAG: HDIG domain-containing protein [Anaerohalosphaeraceae bacterium]|nr:HDIG domain-containing protein [Anaerohalosphaeraceae bacterium]
MGILRKKISQRRKQVRENIATERFGRFSDIINSGVPVSILILVVFALLSSILLSLSTDPDSITWRPWSEILAICVLVILISGGIAIYVHHYNNRIIKKHVRAIALAGLFTTLLILAKIGSFFSNSIYFTIATVITCAIILTIAYDQRFALGMSLFYAPLACFSNGEGADFGLFLTMASGVIVCCFSLREIRTRIKLLEVGALAAAAVFVTFFATNLIGTGYSNAILIAATKASAVVILVGIIIQALLPVIEKVFRIATSMTLLDYSDANQPLLKKLAMEAPGTFSHSLLIGSIAESAAESIGANGLLCRVGAYYHDIGKIGKPRYFVENQMGSANRHEQLSPAMSQLIIVGHIKDGIEMAREYRLPAVIRQFIETHHGTTLVEYFYAEAQKKADGKTAPPSEAEFRYAGPKPQSREAAIVMLSDAVEGAVRALPEVTPTKIETVVHNMAMKRLQDGQFDECELTLRQLSRIEASIAKSLAAHHHGRIAYPKPVEKQQQEVQGNAQ